MTDRFMSAVLAALNESAEVKESDWNSTETVLRGPADQAGIQAPAPQAAEDRFAATVSSCMAKIRSGR